MLIVLFVPAQYTTSHNHSKNSIEQIGTVVLVLAPWSSPVPLTRAWCLFEIMCSLNANQVDFRIRMPTK